MTEATSREQAVSLVEVVNDLQLLLSQAIERVQPLVENTRPIWSDPLWQFLGVILLGVVLFIVLFWLLRFLGGGLAAVTEGSKNILILGVKSMVSAIGAAFKKEGGNHFSAGFSKSSSWLSRARIKQVLDAVRYLTTRRDWRYQTSWYLLAGTQDCGKREWIDSISKGRRTQLLIREKQLMAEGSGWHFFDHGVVVDIDDDSDFSKEVELITTYRPERPLDGIILAVSAKKLVEARDDSAVLRSYGQDLYQKMWSVQKKTGFVIPVYFVVTECDAINGFNAFWSAWSEEPASDMFGWSNPARVDTAFSISWVREAFTSTVNAIRKAQLQVAAGGDEIDDIDGFILFDRELRALEAPLAEVMHHAFARSSFQEALPLRGIWFNGKVGEKIALAEELFSHKIWAETHLAYPIQQRFFSSNRTLRHFQVYALVAAAILLGWLSVDVYRLHNYTVDAQKAWNAIYVNENGNRCDAEGSATWWLLNSLTTLADEPTTLTLPRSWWGGQTAKMRAEAANSILPKKLFSAYECRLEVRADQLNAISTASINVNANVDTLSQQLTQYTEQLKNYQEARARFIHLAGPLPNNTGIANDLRHLTDYLYDGTIPASIDFNTRLIVNGVKDAHYDIEWEENHFVKPEVQTHYLVKLSRLVREKISDKTLTPPLEGIREAFSLTPIDGADVEGFALGSTEEILTSIDQFQQWLSYISEQWLTTNFTTSPCGKFHKTLETLVPVWNYSKTELNTAIEKFDHTACDQMIRHHLEKLNESPFGNLFTRKENGEYTFSDALIHWVKEFSALESLNLLAVSNEDILPVADDERSGGDVIAWDPAPLNDAIDIVLSFQTFRQQWWQTTSHRSGEPFYAPALRARLSQLVEQRIFQAQIREYTQVPDQTLISKDEESRLSASIASFERVGAMLRQLSVLLQQEGDVGNATLLQKQSDQYVHQQLKILTGLVDKNKLYSPLKSVNWKSTNIAEALFSYQDPKKLASYLENQRQRLSFFAQNYAQPLVAYLVDTSAIAKTSNNARLWYSTLLELRRYDRQQPANEIEQLQQYVGKQLSKQSWNSCDEVLAAPQMLTNGGLFAQSHYEIDQRLRFHCQDYNEQRVVRRYFALAERFNRSLKGRFPFAKYSNRKNSDVKITVLNKFLDDYHRIWASPENEKPFLSELKNYLKQYPESGFENWLTFATKIDQFSQFYQGTKTKTGTMDIKLVVEFDKRLNLSEGQDQIIEWQLTSGDDSALFPNGNNRVVWQPGDPLSLSLRWAKGSKFTPLHNLKSPQQVEPPSSVARFYSGGQWALFEWLQRYSQPSQATAYRNWLEFTVPVGIKASVVTDDDAIIRDAKINPQVPEYLSRISVAISAVITGADGSETRLAVPSALPRFAPGLPGELAYQE